VGVNEDVWIPTQCSRCYCQCGIRARRVNGVAVRIEGMPETDMGSRGGLCAKGQSALQVLYDPNRLNVPLRRTNPEKGLHADPKWKEITWDEALDEITKRLKKILDEDGRKLLWSFSVLRCYHVPRMFVPLLLRGACNWLGGSGLHCGGGSHKAAGWVFGSWSIVPDFKYCNYAIYFGTSKGTGAGHSAMITARLAAEARSRGMKAVVFDPICNFAGGKATEWIPIVPGTDGAVILAMCNIIVNEIGILDRTYIATKTNGPYLVGPEGKYIREGLINEKVAELAKTKKEEPSRRVSDSGVFTERILGGTSKPLVWDPMDAKAKPYDDPTIKDFAWEGEYEVAGIKCQPAWQLVKENLKNYTAERASKASSVPAETIRRIATEFAHEARVGCTINLDGYTLPFRPAAAIIFRGASGHTNSLHTCLAVGLLNQIVGNCDVPGGTLGWPARCLGYPGTGQLKYEPHAGADGLLETDNFGPLGHGPWPVHYPVMAGNLRLQDILPLWHQSPFPIASDAEEIWRKLGIEHRIELMLSWGNNTVLNTGNWETVAEFLKKVPFIVASELFNNEFTEGFADIVLPDTCFLEEDTWLEGMGQTFNYPFGMEDWCFHITQAVVKPQNSRRPYYDVMFEIFDRLGMRPVVNMMLNNPFSYVTLNEEYKLGPSDKVSFPETIDRTLKSIFGAEHNWEWFKKQGFIKWPKKVEEAYWRYYVDVRTPIYLEYMVDLKKAEEEIFKMIGVELDLSQYTPFISWFPCPSIHNVDKPEYDMYCFSYRDVLHSGSHTHEQPWLDEVSRMNPYTYNITMNVDTARKKELRDGDTIEIESVAGRKIRGTLKTMKGQHPHTIGIAACSGHWAKGLPIASSKGSNFDNLLEIDFQHADPLSGNLQVTVRVKVRKVERS